MLVAEMVVASSGRVRIPHAGVALLACLATLGLAGSFLVSVVVVPPFTPDQASHAVSDFWRGHEEAAMGRDVARFRHLEIGMPLEVDTAVVAAARALGTPAPAAPRPLRKVAVYVPRQYLYPVEFLARIETVAVDNSGRPTSQPSAVYYHFGRATRGAGWLADFFSPADSQRPIPFALDEAGYASSLSYASIVPYTGYVVQPRAVASALSDYLTSGLESGTPSGPFVFGNHTSGIVNSLRDSYDDLDNQGYDPSGDVATRDFTRAYRAADGTAIVLFAVEATSRVALNRPNDTSVTCIVQSADHLEQWGGLVSSGRYSEIDFVDLLQLIALDPRGGSNERVDVIAGTDDRVAARISAKATRPWLPSCHS